LACFYANLCPFLWLLSTSVFVAVFLCWVWHGLWIVVLFRTLKTFLFLFGIERAVAGSSAHFFFFMSFFQVPCIRGYGPRFGHYPFPPDSLELPLILMKVARYLSWAILVFLCRRLFVWVQTPITPQRLFPPGRLCPLSVPFFIFEEHEFEDFLARPPCSSSLFPAFRSLALLPSPALLHFRLGAFFRKALKLFHPGLAELMVPVQTPIKTSSSNPRLQFPFFSCSCFFSPRPEIPFGSWFRPREYHPLHTPSFQTSSP